MMLSDTWVCLKINPLPSPPQKDLVFVLMFFCLVFGGVKYHIPASSSNLNGGGITSGRLCGTRGLAAPLWADDLHHAPAPRLVDGWGS